MILNVALKEIDFGADIQKVQVPPKLRERYPTGIEFLDAALGGQGMTPSVCTLFTGTPGGGKTTLMLLLADALKRQNQFVVFNTAEESAFQVKQVVERLRLTQGFGMGQETSCPSLLDKFEKLRNKPENLGHHGTLIVDSLQTMTDGKFTSGRITSATGERVLEQLTSYAKQSYCNVFCIGQVTKRGIGAGTNKLKHMVDTYLHISIETNEKSDYYGLRRLETVKNRFGGNSFVSYLKMTKAGMSEIARGASDFEDETDDEVDTNVEAA